jgi:hypothetical protein
MQRRLLGNSFNIGLTLLPQQALQTLIYLSALWVCDISPSFGSSSQSRVLHFDCFKMFESIPIGVDAKMSSGELLRKLPLTIFTVQNTTTMEQVLKTFANLRKLETRIPSDVSIHGMTAKIPLTASVMDSLPLMKVQNGAAIIRVQWPIASSNPQVRDSIKGQGDKPQVSRQETASFGKLMHKLRISPRYTSLHGADPRFWQVRDPRFERVHHNRNVSTSSQN